MIRSNIFRQGQVRLVRFYLILLTLCGASFVTAHPLGNFSVNRYSRLQILHDRVQIFYALDMAEIPTFQEMGRLDLDGDGTVSEAEKETYGAAKGREVASHLNLQINGTSLALVPKHWLVTVQKGQGNLSTLRLELTMETEPSVLPASIHGAGAQSASYGDTNEPERIGWREIVLQGSGIISQTTGKEDITAGLTRYPSDRLTTPSDVRFAEFRFLRPAEAPDPSVAPVASELMRPPIDRFAALITVPDLTPEKTMFFLLFATALGALHALSPGHGKTLVAAYLIGSRGTPRHALYLGLIVTATHTAGVFALGLVTLFASRYLLPEALYPWLSVISGLVIMKIGLTRLLGRGGLFHQQKHILGHAHAHAHHHGRGLTTNSPREHQTDHTHDFFDHEHHHTHESGHSHLPPPGTPISWRSLLALGISGGLVPCPSALVVLLSAIALHRIAFGLVLIIAFSVGLASVLTGIGIVMVKAQEVFCRRVNFSEPLIRSVQKLGAILITCVGLGIAIPPLLTFVGEMW